MSGLRAVGRDAPATRRPSRSSRTAAASWPTSSPARSRCTRHRRHRARGRRARPPALDDPGARGGARRAPASSDWSDLDAVAVTEGPGLAGSLLVGITMAKTLAWLHDLPLVPVNHLEGHIYAAWLLDPDEAEQAGAGVPAGGAGRQRRAHLPRRDGGPPVTTGCSARPSTTRRGRRSTRSAGCSACRIPGGPAIQKAAAERGAARAPLPARVARRHVRLQLQRPQDGRAARGRATSSASGRRRRRRLRRLGTARQRRWRSSPTRSRIGRGRADDQDACARRSASARARSSSAAAWRRTRVLRERIAAGARGAAACRWSCRGRACARTTRR